MQFLWCSSNAPPGMSVITAPHSGILVGIREGRKWAGDNGAFAGFSKEKFLQFLDTMTPYRDNCIFVAVPDSVGDARRTIEMFTEYAPLMNDWPLAFVAQDGQENLPLPDGFSTLFIGGSTAWKESAGAIECIKRGQAMGKHIHIGRVNYARRYQMFQVLEGSEEFTCDGTRVRFEGKERTVTAWNGYMAQQPLVRI